MLRVVVLQLLLLESGLPKKLEPLDPDPVNLTLFPPVVELPNCLGSRLAAGAGSAVGDSLAGHWVIQPNCPVMDCSSRTSRL